ncbi:MAG: septal ring lytic transglycosylase RlpA family protein [Rhizobiaceae bacterium]
MLFMQHRCLRRVAAVLAVAVAGAVLAGCGSPGPKTTTGVKASRSKEYFAESEYGVKASPRVTNQRSRLKRGGGRDQIGRPYKVRGKWYYPKEEKNYRKTGAASWYGDAFHGRLTANGEIYDMTHLTAAHPTMPLPSYARVTNTKNGSSVIVRVNDRGPYANGRIIDLSKRAAEMLDYTHAGVAKVRVEYMGRAPLHGQDDQYLMASYRPAKGQGPVGVPDPSDGLPTGVMVAMAGPTPSGGVGGGAGVAFTAGLGNVRSGAAVASYSSTGALPGEPALPDFGPIAPERPLEAWGLRETQVAMAELSYADERVKAASAAFSSFDAAASGMSPDRLVEAWKERNGDAGYVAIGLFADAAEAERLAGVLGRFGVTRLETSVEAGRQVHSLNVRPGPGGSTDIILSTAWAAGAADAFVVRD